MWNDEKQKSYPHLSKNLTVDVAIIGGGLTGMAAAYLLAKEGKKVAVLEKDQIGHGVTMRTTGFLTQIIDTDYSDLIWMMGHDRAEQIAESHGDAIDLVEKIIEEEKIDCEFTRCSNFIYSLRSIKELKKEASVLGAMGMSAELKEDASLKLPDAGYIEVKDQAKYHPLKYLTGLTEAAEKYGAEIFENTEVLEMTGHTLHTKEGTVTADWIIVATYEPFGKPLYLYFRKGTYISYVYELEMEGKKLLEGTYEDTENPYHYFRVDHREDKTYITIGGEDHREDLHLDPEKCFASLKAYCEKIFKNIPFKVVTRWTGPIQEPIDGLPSIGIHDSDPTLYALGFSGNGMTYAHIAAMIFTDTIHGKETPLVKLYHPDRLPKMKSLLVKGRDYSQELWNGVVKRWFGGK